jgi:hypothetical protein
MADGTGDTWGGHRWKAPDDLWEHTMLATGGNGLPRTPR